MVKICMSSLISFSDLRMPVDIDFREGDKVRMDLHLDTFRSLQTEYGGWVPEFESVILYLL